MSVVFEFGCFGNRHANTNANSLVLMECRTKACFGEVTPLEKSTWRANQYVRYIAAECRDCLMTYWIIDRDGKMYLKDRKGSHQFDQRNKEKPR